MGAESRERAGGGDSGPLVTCTLIAVPSCGRFRPSTFPWSPEGMSIPAPAASSSEVASTLLDAAALWSAVKPLKFLASFSAPGNRF